MPRKRRSVVMRFQKTSVKRTATASEALWCHVGTPRAPGVSTPANGGNAVQTSRASWASAVTPHHAAARPMLHGAAAVVNRDDPHLASDGRGFEKGLLDGHGPFTGLVGDVAGL